MQRGCPSVENANGSLLEASLKMAHFRYPALFHSLAAVLPREARTGAYLWRVAEK